MKIIIINGPNLNLLGQRETAIYGDQNFEAYFESLKGGFESVTLEYFQSNHEGELIDKIHEVGFSYDGIVLNAGAYTHTSLALADALKAVSSPAIEVHISNVFQREPIRHQSYLSPVCIGMISGFGMDGYRMAVSHFINNIKKL